MTATRSTGFRLGLAALYLLSVNLLSGYLAVTFRYPSLWGNVTGLFGEYAYPLPFSWALAHLVTMLPLTMLVTGIPFWEQKRLVQARWVCIAALAVCVGVEVSDGIHRFKKTPFVLFWMVDSSLFLMLTLVFKPPLRTLAAVIGGVLIFTASWVYLPGILKSLQQADALVPEKTELPAPGNFFTRTDLSPDWYHKTAIYYFQLRDRLEPSRPPLPDEICSKAEVLYRSLLDTNPPPAGFASPTVNFMARAWFDDTDKYLYNSGTAELANGHWDCRIVYPDPVSAPP